MADLQKPLDRQLTDPPTPGARPSLADAGTIDVHELPADREDFIRRQLRLSTPLFGGFFLLTACSFLWSPHWLVDMEKVTPWPAACAAACAFLNFLVAFLVRVRRDLSGLPLAVARLTPRLTSVVFFFVWGAYKYVAVLAEPASQSPMFETVHLHTLLLWVFLMFATALFSADSPQGIWRGIGRDIAVVAALALLLIAFWAFLGQFPGQNWKWAWHSGITILAGAGLASYYGARRVDRLVNAVEIAQRGERQEKRFREATYAFLRNTSHEMRAPLNTIVLSADLLLRRPLDEPAMKSVRNIRSFAWDLAYLTDDLLDSAKRRAGKLKVERQEFDIDGCVERVKQWAEPYAKRFKFEVEFKLQSPLGAMISDEGRLRQIIRNMISNACKFGGAGRNPVVEIARELVDGREHLTCRVRDFGKGMDEDFRSRLFVEFEQADGSNARERDGAGLGLSISLSLAQLMGGSLECEWSEPGKGSIFCARIPVTPGVEPSSGD